MWRLKTEYDHGHVGDCSQIGRTLGNEGRPRLASYHWRGAAFPNGTNGDSDGSKRIQTATGGDNPQTAGETPTENFHTHKKATEERGR